jgi:release factor glutamine methyltransferase
MEAAVRESTVDELLAGAELRLAAAGIDTARLDAEVLLAWAISADRTALYARLHEPVPPMAATRFAGALERRCRREPIAYITGTQEFWSLPFAVSPAVLIPRPETELLVEIACRLLRPAAAPRARTTPVSRLPSPVRICDVGTGSGCIAVAIARELAGARVTALDVSPDALALARVNAAAHAVDERITWVESDLFAALPAAASFDVLVSNPPYLAPDDAVSPELAFEPTAALAAGADGFDVIRRLICAAPSRLRPGGWLVMEIGVGQVDAVLLLAENAGLERIVIEPDLAGIPRALVARRRDHGSPAADRTAR